MARILLGDPVGPLPLPKPAQRDLAKISWATSCILRQYLGRRYVWRDAVVNAEPRSEITITKEGDRAKSRLRWIYTCLLFLRSPRCSRNRSSHGKPTNGQRAENVSLQSNDGNIRVTETSGYGYHRLLGRIDGGCAGQAATFSVLAKPAGCSKIKIELHDDAETHNTCLLPLISKVARSHQGRGRLRQCSISLAEDGYFRMSLGLVPTADTLLHFAVTFLNADDGIVYPGRAGKAVTFRKLRHQRPAILRIRYESCKIQEPLVAREAKQS